MLNITILGALATQEKPFGGLALTRMTGLLKPRIFLKLMR